MLVALETARAAVWDAARAFDDGRRPAGARGGARSRSGSCPEAAFRCAKDCVQVLGGIGYTWEHDAHLSSNGPRRCATPAAGPARVAVPWPKR